MSSALHQPAHKVADVMTRTPAALHVTHSLRAAQRLFVDKGFQHLPVIQGGRLVGIVSDRDISRFLAGRPQAADLEVSNAMTQDPVTVSLDTSIEDAAGLLVQQGFHSLPVVEKSGRLVGIVTASDLLRVLVQLIAARKPQAAESVPDGR
jgi:acetoin utilization protein AcuB